MKDKRKLMILAIVLLLAIGFAAVSTTLLLNGSLGIGTNKADFDVRFIAAKVNDVDVSSTAISEDGKTITYEVELENANSRADLDYTILNNSSQYDAAVTIDCTKLEVYDESTSTLIEANATQRGYLSITNNHTTTFKINAKETEDGKLSVKLNKSVIEPITYKLSCVLDVDAVSRDKSGVIKADEIAITGLEDVEYNGQSITTVDQALNYLYENR